MKHSFDDDDSGFFRLETIDTAQSDRVGTSCAIDLRHCPRVDTWFRAELISDYGKVNGFIGNLSRSGLSFEAGKELHDLLVAGTGQAASQASGIVAICFDLPVSNAGSRPVMVQARVVYVVDGDERKYRCGAEFRFFAEGEQALEDYLCARGVAK